MNLGPIDPQITATRQIRLLNLALILIFLLGFGLRLFDLTDEPICCYPLRQLQGAVIARGIFYKVFPSADSTTRDKAIAMEKSMVEHEPRILQHIVAYTYLLPGKEIPWVAGIYNTFFWMIGGVALFALSRRIVFCSMPEQTTTTNANVIAYSSALLALAYYMTLPFSVISSRSFQPDPGMVMWIILASYAIYRFAETQNLKWALLSGLFSGLAILVKLMAFGPIAGVTIGICIHLYAPRSLKEIPIALKRLVTQPSLWVIFLLMVSPTILFYMGSQERVSEYASGWIFSMLHLLLSPGIYLSWARLVAQLFNPLALLIALVGLCFARGRNRALLIGLWLGYFLYGLFFPYQIGTHDYYHLMLVPIVALSMVPAFQFVITRLLDIPKIWRVGFVALVILAITYYSWHSISFWVRDDYRAQPALWQEIAAQLPKDGKVIAVTQDFGMRLLYYGWRNVDIWPNINQIEVRDMRGKSISFDELFAKQTKGKKYFLVTDFAEFELQTQLKDLLNQHYTIFSEDKTYIIYDLSQPK